MCLTIQRVAAALVERSAEPVAFRCATLGDAAREKNFPGTVDSPRLRSSSEYQPKEKPMNRVTSADGSQIAYDCVGSGPAIILVDGALCRRAFGPMPKLAALLSQHFTVLSYDRRGRGDSSDTQPYAVAREVEDIAALIRAAGGQASVFGASSGAALALEAAASGLAITRLVMYEPPFVSAGRSDTEPDHLAKLRQLVAAGRRGDAVAYFMQDMVRVPGAMVVMMRLMFPVWTKLKAAAHTLPYDAAVLADWCVPVQRAGRVKVPTLVLHGGKTDARLSRAAEQVARAIPGAEHRVVAGQTHNVAASALAPLLVEFCQRAELTAQPHAY
jgi:pimeloyl-ACP methyl ester carboxylesterase